MWPTKRVMSDRRVGAEKTRKTAPQHVSFYRCVDGHVNIIRADLSENCYRMTELK
ncbi:hypothetical protein FTUN_3711 [Frigoriglobus tundricola]|uniref:Uncharacterized protein n=1 Tax=Frigoriglobus tundricola TaxID=2774151 RepID=A0A6M5YQ84_9BACT|nr:hypothetical protein FTUN_3711 [Frigoriglobus tundricola]